MDKNDIFLIIAVITLVLLAFLLSIKAGGCLPQQQQETITADKLSEETKSDILKHKIDLPHIFAANKLATFFYIAIAVGGFMIFQGLVKTGLGMAFGGGVGLWSIKMDQTIATKYPWLYLIVGIIAAAGACFFLWKTYKKNQATTQVVGSVQKHFENTPAWDGFKRFIATGKAQSKATQKIVRNIKAKNNF